MEKSKLKNMTNKKIFKQLTSSVRYHNWLKKNNKIMTLTLSELLKEIKN